MSVSWSYRPCHHEGLIEIGQLETTHLIRQATHFHREVQVASVAHGRRLYSSPLGDLWASAGDVVIIPAHLPHASQSSTTSIVTHLYIPSDHPSVRDVAAPQIIRGVHARSAADILHAVESADRDARDATHLPWPGTLPMQVAELNLDIHSMAARSGYSTDGFIRAFRRQSGMTPAAYRVAHRLMIARAELRNGGAVADVAYATRFADQSHFGRLFRRAYGATPAAYRSAFAAS